MDFGWYSLFLGLALGLVPPRWLYVGGCRHLSLLDARTSGLHRAGGQGSGRRRRRWWKLPLIWIDPLRGYGSAYFLAAGLMSIQTDDFGVSLLLSALHGVLIAAVVVMQMEFGRQEPGQLLAPVAFMIGFTAGLLPGFTIVGASVGLLGLATMVATHSFAWGYLVAGAAAGGLGFVFLGPSATLGIFVLTAAAPVPYAFLRRAPLVFPLRG